MLYADIYLLPPKVVERAIWNCCGASSAYNHRMVERHRNDFWACRLCFLQAVSCRSLRRHAKVGPPEMPHIRTRNHRDRALSQCFPASWLAIINSNLSHWSGEMRGQSLLLRCECLELDKVRAAKIHCSDWHFAVRSSSLSKHLWWAGPRIQHNTSESLNCPYFSATTHLLF